MAAASTAGFWLNIILRLLRSKRAPLIKRITGNTQLQSATGFLARGLLTCSSSRFIRTESLKPPPNRPVVAVPASASMASSHEGKHGDESASPASIPEVGRPATPATNHNYAIFKSPSLPSVLANTVKFIKHSAYSASKSMTSSTQRHSTERSAGTGSNSARYLWNRVRIAAGINLSTAEDIAAFADQLRKYDTDALASMQKQLEDLFLRYLRLSAPDSNVALSFLHAIDPVV